MRNYFSRYDAWPGIKRSEQISDFAVNSSLLPPLCSSYISWTGTLNLQAWKTRNLNSVTNVEKNMVFLFLMSTMLDLYVSSRL